MRIKGCHNWQIVSYKGCVMCNVGLCWQVYRSEVTQPLLGLCGSLFLFLHEFTAHTLLSCKASCKSIADPPGKTHRIQALHRSSWVIWQLLVINMNNDCCAFICIFSIILRLSDRLVVSVFCLFMAWSYLLKFCTEILHFVSLFVLNAYSRYKCEIMHQIKL